MPFTNLCLYQIIITAVSAVMIYQGIDNFIRGKSSQTIFKLLIRITVWGGMAAVALFPNITNILAKFMGIEGNINAVILTGFLLVFLMIFKLLSAIEKLEQQISEVTRENALKKIKENHKINDGTV